MNPAALVARWDRVKRAVGRTIALEAFSRGELAVIAIELERCAKRRLRTAILHRQQQRRSRVVSILTRCRARPRQLGRRRARRPAASGDPDPAEKRSAVAGDGSRTARWLDDDDPRPTKTPGTCRLCSAFFRVAQVRCAARIGMRDMRRQIAPTSTELRRAELHLRGRGCASPNRRICVSSRVEDRAPSGAGRGRQVVAIASRTGGSILLRALRLHGCVVGVT
jgi:hypothetical protein